MSSVSNRFPGFPASPLPLAVVSCSAFVLAVSMSVAADGETPVVELETVTVVGTGDTKRRASAESRLEGAELQREVGGTLGRTLERQMGIHNASFGPGVGVPVIRGLTGSRIRTLQDGIASHDAASVSPDHAVTLEPLLAEQITIIRGPATVRYGSGAMGGAVNVSDRRIPDGPPRRGIEAAAEFRYDANGEEKAGVAKLDAGKDFYAVHLDAFHRHRGALQIPGAAIDQAAIRRQFGIGGVASSVGTVPNTDLDSEGGTVGWSLTGDRGLLGMAVNHLENDYGIPAGGHGLGHRHGGGRRHGENVRIDLNQTRYDFKAEWFDPLPHVEKAAFRFGLVDYVHSEMDLGVRATTFRNDVAEGRFELPHYHSDRLSGVAGLHWLDRRFSAVGRETFVPASAIEMLAGYLTERIGMGDFAVELGLRSEHQSTDPEQAFHDIGGIYRIPLPREMRFAPLSLSGALDWKIGDAFDLSLSYGHAERAPDVQELLSLGPHLATRTFDIGNSKLAVEAARNLELGLHWHDRWLDIKANLYRNSVQDYIYLANQGIFFDAEGERLQIRCASLNRCLPVYGYLQEDADFLGYEAQARLSLPDTPIGTLRFTLFSDYVRGRFRSRALGEVPRMPPLRYGAEAGFESRRFEAHVRLTRGEAQRHPGLRETETEAYWRLDAGINYRLPLADPYRLSLFLRADNLLDEEIRNSVSFLRSFAPEPGRSIQFGINARY